MKFGAHTTLGDSYSGIEDWPWVWPGDSIMPLYIIEPCARHIVSPTHTTFSGHVGPQFKQFIVWLLSAFIVKARFALNI